MESTPSTHSKDAEALKTIFTTALATRNFEISQLVQRNNFFMIFQGVLFAGVVQSSHSKPVVSFLVCLAGLVVSVYQTRMASGAKFWQEYWEASLSAAEKELQKELMKDPAGRRRFFSLFHEDDALYRSMVGDRLGKKRLDVAAHLVMKRYSVSRIPIYVGIWLSVVWLFLVLCTLRAYPPLSIPSFIVGF